MIDGKAENADMMPQPIYRSEDLNPSYKLRYAWSGWPSTGELPQPPRENEVFWKELDAAWETDGLRRLEGSWTTRQMLYTFSVRPDVSPTLFVARVKGRMQNALRTCGRPTRFSRKVAFRTVGDNHRQDVEAYIEKQVDKERFADPRFRKVMDEMNVVNPDVDLSEPTESQSGRYWYNLHLVLITDFRHRILDPARLETLRNQALAIAKKKGYAISRLALVPDHLHASLRGNIERSPQEIALAFLNNLAYAMGQIAIWRHGYYAGTFGEYDMQAVRRANG